VEACAFDSYLNQIAQLTRAQCMRLLALLKPAVDQGRTAAVIEEAVAPRLCCPRCQGKQLYRHGSKSGLQRFRCQACGRTFNSLTGTPLARLRHKEKWLDFGDCMLDSRTVRKAAARVKVDKNTSLRWRHRFLMATKTDRPACLNGIAEADETFLLESLKGARNLQRPARERGGKASKRGISKEQVCILVARDRSGNTVDFVTGRGPVTVVQLKEHLCPVLAPDTLLVTDANKAYQAFARQQGISHQYVNMSAGEHVRGAVHVQNVNGYHSRLHKWLRRFNGVATRYLPNYLGWLWAIDQERIRTSETLLRAAIGVFNT
jgi:transposase-like protein/IS1 family transposase